MMLVTWALTSILLMHLMAFSSPFKQIITEKLNYVYNQLIPNIIIYIVPHATRTSEN